MLETMFPKFFWSILIPFFAFLFGGGPRRALLESSEASADLGEGDWKIQTRLGEFMHPPWTQIMPACALAFFALRDFYFGRSSSAVRIWIQARGYLGGMCVGSAD